ncbi:MAG: tyrosine-type recombinase/integrase [Actinomycetota bacterium]|nr:tyrosine-type recombinase/integrase [Actinomycetota bacterium]
MRSLSVHGLRHSHAAYLASKGAPPKVIQERLGHHSAAFTLDRYGHLFPTAQAVTVELVSKSLG